MIRITYRAFAGILFIVSAGCGTEPTLTNPEASPVVAPAKQESCCEAEDADLPKSPEAALPALALDPITIPETRLIDQEGCPVDLVRALIGNRVAAIQFVFTRCTTSCPILGTRFGQLREQLGNRTGKDFSLISITVDPENDKPAVLKAWSERYGAGPGWKLVTGPGAEVNYLLKALGVFPGDRQNHTSQVLVYDGMSGRGLRTSGLTSASELVNILRRVRDARPAAGMPPTAAGDKAAARYFTDTVLIDQENHSHRFYSDLLRGKAVVINVFFSRCNGSCVVMGNSFAKLQEALGDRLERDVRLISITVDSSNDTPEILKAYARKHGTRHGWYFLTGDKENVNFLLGKLGQSVEAPESHSSILLVGNLRTGLWKKVFGLADFEQVLAQVEAVIQDRPAVP